MKVGPLTSHVLKEELAAIRKELHELKEMFIESNKGTVKKEKKSVKESK